MYRFLENFETGIPFIDNGHRRLLEDMEEAREALAANHEDEFHRLRDQLLMTMQEHIVKQHVYEEEIMTMSRDPELSDQQEAHTHFRSVIDRHKSSMNFQNDAEDLTSLMNFLNEWFLQHILSSDMLIGSALKKAKAAAVKAKAQAAKEARTAEAAQAAERTKAAETSPAGTTKANEAASPTKPAPKSAAPAKKAPKKRTASKKTTDAPEENAAASSSAAVLPKSAAQPNTAEKPAKKAPKKKAAVAAPPQKSAPAATVVKKQTAAPADPFAFTDEFRTRIPLVDKEHETLFKLIRQTYDLVHDEFIVDKFDQIVAIVEGLREYTIKHFADEERYMKSINYDGLAEQVAAHTAFVEQLNNIDFDEIDRNQEGALDDLIKFLLNWLVQHILKIDKKMPYVEEAALKLTE